MIRRVRAQRLRDELQDLKQAGCSEFVVVPEGIHPNRSKRKMWTASIDEVIEVLESFIDRDSEY